MDIWTLGVSYFCLEMQSWKHDLVVRGHFFKLQCAQQRTDTRHPAHLQRWHGQLMVDPLIT